MADKASANGVGLEPLTVDEMLAKYPKPNVDKAIYNRQYTQSRELLIEKFERQIQAGINAESCQRGLKNLLENSPPGPP